MAIADPPKCPYCGGYHFNYCSQMLLKEFDNRYRCVICELPIFSNESMVGMGNGSDEYLEQQFAHEACYWRHRAKTLETEVEQLTTYVAELEYRCYRAEETQS